MREPPGRVARGADTPFVAVDVVTQRPGSEQLAQVHAGVELPHLRFVAVEHLRLAAFGEQTALLADAPLGGLTPAWMRDLRVDVGIEAVFLRRGHVPGGARLLVGEADLHQRLAALEAVLPGHHQAQRRAILVGQHLAVHAEGQQGQRVHGLVDAQALDIGPVERAAAQARHLGLVGQGHELDEPGLAGGLDAFDEFGQGVADPGDHHGPALDAAQAVDALLQGAELEQAVDVEDARLADLALDADRPGPGLQGVGRAHRVALVGAELVVVVVAAGVLVAGGLVHHQGTGHGTLEAGQLGQFAGGLGLGQGLAAGPARQGRAGGTTGHQAQPVAPVFVQRLRRDFGGRDRGYGPCHGSFQQMGASLPELFGRAGCRKLTRSCRFASSAGFCHKVP
eukprot:Opistho-1_new@80615